MKIILAALALVSGTFCSFSESLVSKYSLEVLHEGQ